MSSDQVYKVIIIFCSVFFWISFIALIVLLSRIRGRTTRLQNANNLRSSIKADPVSFKLINGHLKTNEKIKWFSVPESAQINGYVPLNLAILIVLFIFALIFIHSYPPVGLIFAFFQFSLLFLLFYFRNISKMAYVITNQRVIVLGSLYDNQIRTYNINKLPYTIIDKEKDGKFSIYFGIRNNRRHISKRLVNSKSRRQRKRRKTRMIGFICISEIELVQKLLLENMDNNQTVEKYQQQPLLLEKSTIDTNQNSFQQNDNENSNLLQNQFPIDNYYINDNNF
ncbi:hypothetical protein M0813_24541 [Anaeramoeba flamelloides]|uniref:Transmembrane protein n=1 Tax=Anaeramoeba flamelloides TaxID=1746091 RepID=A0ABQ8Y7L6_9EUKA|nr:hypothetical protein M0813_24541 [Anaeramoeba flamelloides]